MRKLPAAIERDADDGRLLRQVVDYYHQTLMQSPRGAAPTWSGAGIAHRMRSSTFQLGFANRTLG